jgi:hypothetical protein
MTTTEVIIFGAIWGIQAIGWAIFFIREVGSKDTITLGDVLSTIATYMMCGILSLLAGGGTITLYFIIVGFIIEASETKLVTKFLNLKIKDKK